MQIKFKRYNGTQGMIFKDTTYCLEAILLPTEEEAELIGQFSMWGQNVSTHGNLDLDRYEGNFNGQILSLSMEKLRQGAALTFENMNCVLYAERLIIDAAQSVLGSAQTLATFDGSERVVELDRNETALVEAE